MKRKWIIPAGMLTMICTILGCTKASQDLVQEDYLRLERSPHGAKVRALWFSVREQNHGLVVSGVLKQYQRNARPIKAHVHVTVRTPDGRVFVERRSQDLYVPRNRIGGGSRYFKRFTVRLDIMPPPASVIQIVAHRGTRCEAVS